jgi:hypothetical protein
LPCSCAQCELLHLAARVPVLGDDDVVVHGDAERLLLRFIDDPLKRVTIAGGLLSQLFAKTFAETGCEC